MFKPAYSRMVAIALTLIPATIVFMIGAPAFSSYQDHRDHLASLAKSMLAYRAVIAAAPAERATRDRLRRSPELNQLVIQTQEAATAVAQLQEIIAGIATTSGARLIQSASQVMAPDGARTELGTHIVIEADIGTVGRVLHELEAARPLLIVRRCTIRDPDGEWADAGSHAPGPNLLLAELDVSGFMGRR